DGAYGAAGLDAQQVAEQLHGVIGQATDQAVAPLQAQLSEMQLERGAAELVAHHPELGEPANAERLIGAAHEVAAAMGAPELAMNPSFWGLVHQAMGPAQAQAQQQQQ